MQKCKEIFFQKWSIHNKQTYTLTYTHTHTHTHTTHNTHTHTHIRKIAISDIIHTTCHIIYTRFISIHSCKTDSQKLRVKREVLHTKLKKTSRTGKHIIVIKKIHLTVITEGTYFGSLLSGQTKNNQNMLRIARNNTKKQQKIMNIFFPPHFFNDFVPDSLSNPFAISCLSLGFFFLIVRIGYLQYPGY